MDKMDNFDFILNLNRKLDFYNEYVHELQEDNYKLREEINRLNEKIKIINDYYQMKMSTFKKTISENHEIEMLKREIESLKSKALINPKKITEYHIVKVKELRELGLSYKKIAKETALSTTTICRIMKGEYNK